MLEAAILNYKNIDGRYFNYIRTLVLDFNKGTCEEIDIREEIYERRSSFEVQRDIELSQGEADYRARKEE